MKTLVSIRRPRARPPLPVDHSGRLEVARKTRIARLAFRGDSKQIDQSHVRRGSRRGLDSCDRLPTPDHDKRLAMVPNLVEDLREMAGSVGGTDGFHRF